MDVQCSACGTEYEFDDAKVTAAGVTVKCTQCGHVFKVRRPERVPAAPATIGRGDRWKVRQPDGQVFEFKELTTLQKWIVERKVGRDDQISRTGENWKSLGDIAELASFFQVVDDARRAEKAAAAVPESPATMQANTFFSATAPQAAPTSASHNALASGLEDDDPVAAWQSGRRRTGYIAAGLVALLALGGAGYVFRAEIQGQLGALQAGQRDAIAPRVHAAVAMDHWPVLSAELARSAPDAALTRVVLGASQVALQHDAARLKTTFAAAGSAEQALDKAALSTLLESARQSAPADAAYAAALLAAADGNVAAVRVERSAAHADATTPRWAHVQALAAARAALAAGAGPALEASRAALGRLRQSADGKADARLLHMALAVDTALFTASAAAPGALSQLDEALSTALSAAPGDVRLVALQQAVQAKMGPGAHGATKTAVKKLAPGQPEAHKATAGTADKNGDRPAAPAAPVDVAAAMKKADRARDRGSLKTAGALYKKVVAAEPGHARAHMGLGWIALDVGRNTSAAREFRKALKSKPSLAEARFGLAEALRFSGNRTGAIAAYERFLDDAPGSPDAAVARNALRQLKSE